MKSLVFAICALISVSLAVPITQQTSLNDVEQNEPGYDARSGEQLVRKPRQFFGIDVDVIGMVWFAFIGCIMKL